MRRSVLALLLGATLMACACPGWAQETGRAVIPPFTGFVTDAAGILGEETALLEGFLDQLQRKTGVQFAVLTVRSTAPEDPGDYKVRAFEAYGIGDAVSDEGLLLLVAMEERALRFETGYGLEGTLPDGWQAAMLRREAVPAFREGRYAEGVRAAVQQAALRIAEEKGVSLEWDGRPLTYDSVSASRKLPPSVVALILFAVIVMAILAASSRPGRRRGRGFRGGGFGGSGGGFGGWGGGFGGGGGSSFGGFGGGGSGGGGGGANW